MHNNEFAFVTYLDEKKKTKKQTNKQKKKHCKKRFFCFIVEKKTDIAVKWLFTYPCWR